ncbi:hypothetical protein FB451DRAFT_1527644 [Mycena latifolia]|nr:hypothetical protein FB451DRAFT_1527644 [Mycena latifolia]
MSPGLLCALLGRALLAFVAGVFAYALAAVKQDTTEDERRAMQIAAAHATAGAGSAGAAEPGMGAGKGGTKARLSEHSRGSAAVPTPAQALEEETPTPSRGMLPALLERRAPWLLDPTRKTPVWAHDFSRYASLVITLVGALAHLLVTIPLAAPWRTLRALNAENELDAWKLDGLKVLWALLAL